MSINKRSDLKTESINKNSINIDSMSTYDILQTINNEDMKIPKIVGGSLDKIEVLVDICVKAIKNGKRIFYVGSGTSGRLGVLDASEMPPTFKVPNHLFTGIIAGGDRALKSSIEGAEDIGANAIKDLKKNKLMSGDVVIGISASGAAKYVVSAIEFANKCDAKTAYIICNEEPFYKTKQDVLINIQTGEEVITGSTRMKAGTATKLVLNMISTTVMIKIGKVYKNFMVDLKVVNKKLKDRGVRIIKEITKLSEDEAGKALSKANNSVKCAIIMIEKSCSYSEACQKLSESDGFLDKVI